MWLCVYVLIILIVAVANVRGRLGEEINASLIADHPYQAHRVESDTASSIGSRSRKREKMPVSLASSLWPSTGQSREATSEAVAETSSISRRRNKIKADSQPLYRPHVPSSHFRLPLPLPLTHIPVYQNETEVMSFSAGAQTDNSKSKSRQLTWLPQSQRQSQSQSQSESIHLTNPLSASPPAFQSGEKRD